MIIAGRFYMPIAERLTMDGRIVDIKETTMEQRDVREAIGEVADRLAGKVPQAKKEDIQAELAEEFRRLDQDGKIYSMGEDEVELLIAYRQWKESAAASSGVFHWRKK